MNDIHVSKTHSALRVNSARRETSRATARSISLVPRLIARTAVVRTLTIIATAASLIACDKQAAPNTATDSVAAPRVVAFDNPADSASAHPGITLSPSGGLYLSWLERRPDSTITLRYAVRTADTWSPVRDVNTGKNIIVSAGDVPSVYEQPGGKLVAVWRGSHTPKGYDIVMAFSVDKGATWSTPRSPHRDTTDTEHGFVSWLQLGDTSALVWVDGRGNANADKAKRATQLALALIDTSGMTGTETFLDTKICDCCHTSAAALPGGAVVVYRDRKDGEIRDINAVRISNGVWRQPVAVHNDDWHIEGCPVNGPAVSARGAQISVAWFTAAHDTARVRVAFSSDTGTTFGAPVQVNEGFPDGHVGIAMTAQGTALVSWIERKDSVAVLRLRSISSMGVASPIINVATLGESKRAGGQPKLLLDGDHAVLAWTDAATNRVRTARVELP